MTQGSNAGIKRNRRPTGSRPPVRIDAKVSVEAMAALDAARFSSGDLSVGLYLERLIAALVLEHGAMPVLSPVLDFKELHVTAA